MARRALLPCNTPGCKALSPTGRCPAHQRERYQQSTARRAEGKAAEWYDQARQWYTSPRWAKARRHHLQREPLCVACKQHGVIRTATIVDHIEPHRGNADLFWDSENWQSLCEQCHNRKSATEKAGPQGMGG